MRSLLRNSLVRLQCLEQGNDALGELETTVGSVESVQSSPKMTSHKPENLNRKKAIPNRRCHKRKLVEIETCVDVESDMECVDDKCSDASYSDEEDLEASTSTGRKVLVRGIANSGESSTYKVVAQNLKNHQSIDLCASSSSAAPRRIHPRTIPVYHGMNKKKLQELCKMEGILSTGSDHELRQRHLEFLRLCNAECDAKNPRSKDQLVREVTQRENARKAEVKKCMLSGIQAHTKYLERIKESRKALGAEEHSSGTVSSGNMSFDHLMKVGFKNLIHAYNAKKSDLGRNSREHIADNNSMIRRSGTSQGPEGTVHPPDPQTDKLPSAVSSASSNPSPTTVVIREPPLKGVTTRSRSGSSRGVTKKDVCITSTLTSFSNSNSSVKQLVSSSKKNTVPASSRKTWICNQCTYVNEAIPWSNTKAKCGMCQMSRNLGMTANKITADNEVIEIDICKNKNL